MDACYPELLLRKNFKQQNCCQGNGELEFDPPGSVIKGVCIVFLPLYGALSSITSLET